MRVVSGDMDLARIDRIEAKLDEILYLLGKGRPRSITELRRDAEATVIRLQSRKKGGNGKRYERQVKESG